MQTVALPVGGDSIVATPSEYPEGTAGEDWANDEEALGSYAVSTCANAWGLIYSQLFDGLRCEGGMPWQQPQRQ